MKCICEPYVTCDMYIESCTILVVVNRLSRPVVVLDRLPGLYGLKYDSTTACGLPLYLCSCKLVGSMTSSNMCNLNIIGLSDMNDGHKALICFRCLPLVWNQMDNLVVNKEKTQKANI